MASDPTPAKLALFFTRGMSLARWDALGMLRREVAIYRKLQKRGVEVTFITYGDASEEQYTARLPGIQLCYNRFGLPGPLYERLIPVLHAPALRRARLYKTNQIAGGATALTAARMHGRPLIARCGYLWSEFMQRRNGPDAPATLQSLATEWQVFHGAARVVVTTRSMRRSLRARFPWLNDIRVVPNYVDTDLFAPAAQVGAAADHLCYIGRLDEGQKNLSALVEAVRGLGVTLDLIGDGPLRPSLEQEAARNPRLRLLGGLPHDELPRHLHRATAFVLPSHYEGHPKTLIEAMACGAAVIASDVPGIREVVTDGQTGALCEPNAESLRDRITTVLGDGRLRRTLGTGARAYALAHFSLDQIVGQELALYEELTTAQEKTPC